MYLSIKVSALLITSLISGLALCVGLNISMAWGLGFTAFVTFFILVIKGAKPSRLALELIPGIKRILPVIVILGSVGGLIATWMHAGVLAYLLNYSFTLFTQTNLALTTFVLSLSLSMVLGTAIGTIGTLGTLFLALAKVMAVPSPLIVGAMVSGAYFGDRTSPLSSSANLTASVTGVNIRDHVNEMLKLSLVPLLVSLMLYAWVGSPYQLTPDAQAQIDFQKNLLNSAFTLRWYHLSPVLVLVASISLLKQGILKSVLWSWLTTCLLGLVNQVSLVQLVKTTFWGYRAPGPDLASLFSGSGVQSMTGVFSIITLAAIINSLFTYGHVLDPFFQWVDKNIKSPRGLLYRSGFVSLLIMVVTCNQSLPAIITGTHYKDAYTTWHLKHTLLSRVISDFSIILVALVPWNINALLVDSVTSVSATSYSPYAYLPLLIVGVSCIDIAKHKKSTH